MTIDVCKFGGSSLASPEKIKHVGEIVRRHLLDKPTIIVLSAMQGETDRLKGLAAAMCCNPTGRELDALLSTGEQASVALLALYLNANNIPTISLNAQQAGLVGSGTYQAAALSYVDKSIINSYLEQGITPIVTGFQVSFPNDELATLERGGSDTTAVGLAAAFDADCFIYSDVAGVYSADPNLISQACHWRELNYDDMLQLSAVGAKVLQIRAIGLAKRYKVKLILRSTFNQQQQTLISAEENCMSEFFGLSLTKNRYLLQIKTANLERLSESGIKFDEVFSLNDKCQVVVEPTELPVLKAIFVDELEISELLAKLSLVGFKGQEKTLFLNKIIAYLRTKGICPTSYRATKLNIDIWVPNSHAELVANLLHDFSKSEVVQFIS